MKTIFPDGLNASTLGCHVLNPRKRNFLSSFIAVGSVSNNHNAYADLWKNCDFNHSIAKKELGSMNIKQ